MTGPRFDFSINLGHALTFGGLIITMSVRWAIFDTRLRAVEKVLEAATTTLVEQLRQASAISAIEQRLQRLERIIEAR